MIQIQRESGSMQLIQIEVLVTNTGVQGIEIDDRIDLILFGKKKKMETFLS